MHNFLTKKEKDFENKAFPYKHGAEYGSRTRLSTLGRWHSTDESILHYIYYYNDVFRKDKFFSFSTISFSLVKEIL